MKYLLGFFFIFFTLGSFINKVFAQSKILINEFLIDPQPQQVEIINVGTESADISGWIIDDSGGTTFYTIPQSSILSPQSCLVFSGDFNLNKSSADVIRLINNSITIDSFSYKASSGSGISYMRLPDGDDIWTTGSANLGFFNSNINQLCLFSPSPIITPTEILTLTPTITPTPEKQSAYISYENIYISEVMTYPNTGNNEWIEFYNDNNFPVSLIDWYIDDLENAGSTPKKFSLDIPPKSYRVFNLSSSMFNNNKDSVRLLDFDKNLKGSFEYNNSIQGKTFGRITLENDEFCLQEPSYEASNNSCLTTSSQPTKTLSQKTNITPTKIIYPTSKSIVKPKNNNLLKQNNFIYPTFYLINNDDDGEILGITTKRSNNLNLKILNFISFSYSLLTIITVLSKIKSRYGKDKTILSSFINTSRNQ